MNNKMMLPIELTKILYSQWDGNISISSEDSEIYGKCLEGPGSVTFKNGNRYEGNFHNGLLSGHGKFIWANGIVYEGQFKNNRITGSGVYSWPDGSTYEGEVKDGLRHGFGVYKIDDATYEGNWVEGRKEGKGKIIFKSGSIFEGQFKNDLKHGLGKMYYYPSGNFFQGNWENDLKQGSGTMNWTDLREKYSGNWHRNLQHGWGIHIWLQSKGQGKFLRNRYEGNWAKGVREGFGTFYYANGSKYEGYWKDNMKQGFAFYTNENGKISLIQFEQDRVIKNETPQFQFINGKKVANKKQVDPNFYSLCLRINYLFSPFTPNLQSLFNILLRNNSQLKFWYKGLANFYDQQSEFSFCLNFEGVWKMVRALKILGDFSLANVDRGFKDFNPKIEDILCEMDNKKEEVDFQDMHYEKASVNFEQIDFQNPVVSQKLSINSPFKKYKVHDRQKNLLFRQFIHLLIWMAYIINPDVEKLQKCVQKILSMISPMLQNISKAIKAGTNDNISENMSSVSKGEKSISSFYKSLNLSLLQILRPVEKRCEKHDNYDLTITMRELIGYGRESQVIKQNELMLLQRIIDKYMNPEITSRPGKSWWNNSLLSSKLLHILNYELIQYEFVEMIYYIIIKKLPSHKETEENKRKYEQILENIFKSIDRVDEKRKKQEEYALQKRILRSKKSKVKIRMEKKRSKMQKEKLERTENKIRLQKQAWETKMMAREDKDIQEEQFEEESSEISI